MSVKVITPELAPGLAANARKAELDWVELHSRLDASEAALKRRLTPSPEETQKILRARARSLAGERKIEAKPQHLLLEVVEFVLGTEHYGVESSHIREIHPLNEFTPLPCTPTFV